MGWSLHCNIKIENVVKKKFYRSIYRQGDEASTAFLILSGSLEVQIDGKKVGKMESGEIFGELSLILEKKPTSIKAISPSR